MTNPEHASETIYQNVNELLLAVSARNKELEGEAKRKLYELEDATGFRDAHFQRGKLLADLPNTIRSFEEKGGVVPVDVVSFAASIAWLAKEYTDTENIFGLSTLLIPKGSQIGDPDDLERLAALFMPTTEH